MLKKIRKEFPSVQCTLPQGEKSAKRFSKFCGSRLRLIAGGRVAEAIVIGGLAAQKPVVIEGLAATLLHIPIVPPPPPQWA